MQPQVNIVDVQAQTVTATLPAAKAIEQVVGAGHRADKVLATPERRLKYGLFPITYTGKPGAYQQAQGYTETHDWQAGTSTRTYNVVDIPLADAIAQLVAKVDPIKEAGQFGGMIWSRPNTTEVYAVDTNEALNKSITWISGAALSASQGQWRDGTDYWTMAPIDAQTSEVGASTDVYLATAEMVDLGAKVFIHSSEWHQAARTHKEAIKQLADVAAVRSYESDTLGTGWPSS